MRTFSMPPALLGDGRLTVYPFEVMSTIKNSAYAQQFYAGGKPVTRALARRIALNFMESEHSTHSAAADTMWVPLVVCYHNDFPFEIHAMPGVGYALTLEAP